MVYVAKAVARANERLAPSGEFEPGLVESLEPVETVAEAAIVLELADVVPEEYHDELAAFLTDLPPAIDAAIVAAAKNALRRGVPVTVTWEPGYGHQVRVWDVTKEEPDGTHRGMVNVHLVSPDPFEDQYPG